MFLLFFLAFILLSSLLFIYVMLFGPSEFHRDGLVGRMHYTLLLTIPDTAERLAIKVIGVRTVKRVKGLVDYVLHQSNPLLQLFYIFLVTGACIIFLSQAYGRVLEGEKTSAMHTILTPVLIAITYYFFYVACKSDPGKLTPDLVAQAQLLYPYDEILFTRKTCDSCHFEKPARSKHCSLCNACIARFDHHCAWINNCVGANNTRYFWRFLLMTSILAFYFSGVIVDIFWNTVVQLDLYSKFVRDPATGHRIPVSHSHVLMYLLHTDLALSMLLLFAFLVGLILFLFLLYHIHLVAAGTTTSETFKWEDVRYQIKHGDPIIIGENGRESRNAYDSDEGEAAPAEASKKGKGKKSSSQQGNGASSAGVQRGAAKERKGKGGEAKKLPVVIDDVKKLKNIYHHGIFANIKEILFPPHLW